MVVEVGPEIEQLVSEIASRPEQQVEIAHRRIVAGWEILRNHGRNNNSPGTG